MEGSQPTWGGVSRTATVVALALISGLAVPPHPAALAQLYATGPQLHVNTFTSANVRSPAVAVDADGDFVVAWSSERDDSGDAVFAQRYASDGSPVGVEFQVNSYTFVNQYQPAVAASSGGDFVVVWTSPQDGHFDGIFGQRYSSDGSPTGTEFQVNSYTVGGQRSPFVSADVDGDFFVTWNGRNGPAIGVFGQRFASNGNPVGSEFQINTYTLDDQIDAAVAMDADGDAVVTWWPSVSVGQPSGILARRYASSGAPIGSEFQVNSYTPAFASGSDVAAAANGDFVIAWVNDGQDGSYNGVFAQRFASDGSVIGSEFQINEYTRRSQSDPSVAAAANGEFVVTWTSHYSAYGRRYASNGTPLDAEFRISGPEFVNSTPVAPRVAAGAAGDYVVVWEMSSPTGAIRAQRYTLTPPACPAAPLPGCTASARSVVRVKDADADGAGSGDALAWKWLQGPATAKEDFGFPPANANYLLCVYAGTAPVLAMQTVAPAPRQCDGRACWTETGSRGFKYQDRAAANDGVKRVLLRAGSAGKAKITLKGLADELDLTPGTLPLDGAGDVVVQLSTNANDNCWEAVFPPASIKENSEERFKATIP